MRPQDGTSAQLATFDQPLAEAVVTVLRRQGVPATAEPRDDAEAEVRVPAARRDEALGLLATHMEQVRELVQGATPDDSTTTTPLPLADPDDDESGRPMVMERLRRMGLGLAAVLAPLLVITLAEPNLPIRYALLVFLAGLVAVVYWRNRRED